MMSSLCVHLDLIDKAFSSEILRSKYEGTCNWCGAAGPNLWLCLYKGCFKLGCAENVCNHSSLHNSQIPSHCIALNISNLKAWCYMCEMQVTNYVVGKLNSGPTQQSHLGGAINAGSISIARPLTPSESSTEGEEKLPFEIEMKPKGLVGLRNLGLTCYMNAALQALSNSVPLACYMRDCAPLMRKHTGVVQPFSKLIDEIWHYKRPGCVTPSTVYYSFRTLYPMFRPYTQQDSQEFLRYFMDQLHEELRQPYISNYESEEEESDANDVDPEISSLENLSERESHNDSVAEDYETCDSGMSDRSAESDSAFRIQPLTKKKKMHHLYTQESKRRRYRVDHDLSDFSDALSDNLMAESKSLSGPAETFPLRATSSSTSGIGRSHPTSRYSLNSISTKVNDPVQQETKEKSGKLFKESSARKPLDKSDKAKFDFLDRRNDSWSSWKGENSLTSRRVRSLNSVGGISSSGHMSSPSKSCAFSGISQPRKSVRYRSIVSDTFDGILVSSVQCLTCNTTSSRRETFQDLSLPIPSSDQLSLLLQHPPLQNQHPSKMSPLQNSPFNAYLNKNACDVATNGWMWHWVWSAWGWLKSWLWGPNVSLSNCLAAFFSADELKGDNMYSCEKCGKLRNGVKYSKVIQLPEILIIHLKRFRHEYMFSSKIGQYVSFPLHGLDLSMFLHKDSKSQVKMYDLYSVICHHGAAGSGHYTAYALNVSNNRWYEFDDQCVTEATLETVANCEAYVLFYKKCSPEMVGRRRRTLKLMQVSSRVPSLMQFYVSKQWINKFNTFAEPGPIDNSDFLCPHGGVQPLKAHIVEDLVLIFNQGVWEYLHQVFGGGPACTSLYECITCREEQEALIIRQKMEYDTFFRLHTLFREEDQPSVVYAISMKWFRTWEAFVRGRQQEPPGHIDNSGICTNKLGQLGPKPGSDYAPISKDLWNFFSGTYGGGPEIFVRYGVQIASEGEVVERRRESYDEFAVPFTTSRSKTEAKVKSLSTENLLCTGTSLRNIGRQRTVSAGEVELMFDRNDVHRFGGNTRLEGSLGNYDRPVMKAVEEYLKMVNCVNKISRNGVAEDDREVQQKVLKWLDNQFSDGINN